MTIGAMERKYCCPILKYCKSSEQMLGSKQLHKTITTMESKWLFSVILIPTGLNLNRTSWYKQKMLANFIYWFIHCIYFNETESYSLLDSKSHKFLYFRTCDNHVITDILKRDSSDIPELFLSDYPSVF